MMTILKKKGLVELEAQEDKEIGYRYNYDNATGERVGGFGSTNK